MRPLSYRRLKDTSNDDDDDNNNDDDDLDADNDEMLHAETMMSLSSSRNESMKATLKWAW